MTSNLRFLALMSYYCCLRCCAENYTKRRLKKQQKPCSARNPISSDGGSSRENALRPVIGHFFVRAIHTATIFARNLYVLQIVSNPRPAKTKYSKRTFLSSKANPLHQQRKGTIATQALIVGCSVVTQGAPRSSIASTPETTPARK